MAKPKVLFTGELTPAVVETLSQEFDVTYPKNRPYTRAELLAALPGQEALVFFGYQVDQELVDAGKDLKVIATCSVGFDHIDLNATREKGIVVANTPESVRVPTAEMGLALMLDVTRNIVPLDDKMHAGEWTPMTNPDNHAMSVQGKTLGIFGMGRIGKTMAQFGQMLGMHVIYHNRHQLPADAESAANVKFVSFDELVQQADVLSLHAPATPETTHIINADVFKQMKDSAFLINVARGALVKTSDLADALQNHEIAGAGLDVFENEPEVPVALTGFDNVVMTPHAGTGTVEAQIAIFEEAVGNVRAALAGKPTNVVNGVE